MKKLLLLALLPLAGCAMNVTMMPRDSGKTYAGELNPSGGGGGSMSMTIGEDKCTGPAARVASNQTFGFLTTYGKGGSSFGTVATDGDVSVKAVMSCPSGRGLRCDLTGQSGTGGGICVDDQAKVYDVVFMRK